MEVNLLEYLPYEIRKYKDYQVIMEAENPEFIKIYTESKDTLNDSFIMSASEKAIERFENMLKITPSSGDTLDDRRMRILTRWNLSTPYTWRVLLQKLNAICGVGNYTIILENDKYTLQLETHMTTQNQYEDLLFVLDSILPVNIKVNSSNTLSDTLNNIIYSGTTIIDQKSYTLTNSIKDSQTINNAHLFGNVISQYRSYTIGGM